MESGLMMRLIFTHMDIRFERLKFSQSMDILNNMTGWKNHFQDNMVHGLTFREVGDERQPGRSNHCLTRRGVTYSWRTPKW